MRFLSIVILIAILSAAAEYFMPWWSVAVVAFIVSFITRFSPGRSFLAGFSGVGLAWLVAALLHDIANQHILSTRMANLFPLHGSYPLFIAVTVFVGALTGGLSALAGALFAPGR